MYASFEDDMDYGEEMSEDGEEAVSDEDEEVGEMGEIEGLPGDAGVVEVIMGEDEGDESMDDDEDEDQSDDEDEVEDDDDMGSEDDEDHREVVDEEGNPIEDDGASGWESETSEEGDEDEAVDYEAEARDLNAVHIHNVGGEEIVRLENMVRAAMDAEDFDG